MERLRYAPLRYAVYAAALFCSSPATGQESIPSGFDSTRPLDGLAIDTCIAEGARRTEEESSRGESLNGIRILTAINLYAQFASNSISKGGTADQSMIALASAVEHCTPQDYDAGLQSIPTMNFGSERETFYRDMIALLRTLYQSEPL